MLIRFRVSNFLSIKEQIELSMLPGKTRLHPSHVVKGKQLDLLRAALIYGANAAGKSNLVKAINFAQTLIVEGTEANKAIPIRPFKLDPQYPGMVSKFEFEISCGDNDYIYGFELDAYYIHSEWLYQIRKDSEKKLFERLTSSQDRAVEVEFGKGTIRKAEDRKFFQFVARATPPNQLFLAEAQKRNIKQYEEVFNWFKSTLIVIFPTSRYSIVPAITLGESGPTHIADYLEKMDTGVCDFELKEFNPEPDAFPSKLIDDFNTELKPGDEGGVIIRGGEGEYDNYAVRKEQSGELTFRKLMLKHRTPQCEDGVFFDLGEESDGTIRLIDLIPVLDDPKEHPHVYVIDELDRSLHPRLSINLIRLFLGDTNSISQFIATTHEANLLNQDLVRRDEIWFVEKRPDGSTDLYSLEEFNPRFDKNLEKGYLQGRYGGVPVIGHVTFEGEEEDAGEA